MIENTYTTFISFNFENKKLWLIFSLGAQAVSKGVQANKTLQVLKIGRNPLQSAGICYILNAAYNNPSSPLQELQMNDIAFDLHCQHELDALMSVKSDFSCSWAVSIKGGRVDSGRRKPEVWELFLAFLRTREWRLMDIFKILTKESADGCLTLDNFVIGMKNSLYRICIIGCSISYSLTVHGQDQIKTFQFNIIMTYNV